MANILLLEPDKTLAKIYSQSLKSAGHSVFHELTSESAIYSLDDNKIDLIILELQIALHNGLEFLYELRSYADWQDIPVIINTQVDPKKLQGSSAIQLCKISKILYKPETKLIDLVDAVQAELKLTHV